MKIFSKPSRIGTPGIDKASKPPPSPSKLGQISAPIPWLAPGNKAGLGDESRRPSYSSLASGYSMTSTLVDPSAAGVSFLLGGSGTAGGGGGTPLYTESPPTTLIERGFKDPSSSKEDGGGVGGVGGAGAGAGAGGGAKKEKSHHRPHFLRPRDKDHGTFSSSSSNSKIADPAGSLYSFGPSSPGSSVFVSSKDLQQSISGMDMIASSASLSASKTSKTFKAALGSSSSTSYEESLLAADLTPAAAQDAWPIFCSRVLPLFDGDPLRNTVEDLNKLMSMHIRRCVERRDPVQLLTDVRKLLEIGLVCSNLLEPHLLADLPDERLLARLVEIWALLFGYTTPYLEAVFLPLQQEFKGAGPIMSARESREFFGLDVPVDSTAAAAAAATAGPLGGGPLGLDVRRLIMLAVRDCVVLPVYERLRVLFSRLQMDFSRNQEESMEVVGRMLQCVSVLAAAGCCTGSAKVSKAPKPSKSSTEGEDVDNSNNKADNAADDGDDADDHGINAGGDEEAQAQAKVEELGRTLKWNWLSRGGRTGRNRRGFVGTKMRTGG